MKPVRLLVKTASITSLILACSCAVEAHAQTANTNRAAARRTSTVSEAEAREFTTRLETLMNSDGQKEFVDFINVDALLDRALSGLEGTEKAKASFRKGFKSGFSTRLGESFKAISGYKLLRISSTNGEQRALYRALVEAGLNYHTVSIRPGRNGRLEIVDLEIALTGEPLSTTIRRIALPVLAESEKGFLARLAGTESDLIKYQKDLLALFEAGRSDEPEKVIALFEKLPASLQREKFVLAHRLKASQQISDKEYQKTLEIWMRNHPGDLSLALISIDAYAMKKQHKEVLAAVDRLEKIVGHDPYLNILRASQHWELKEPEKARAAAERVIKEEPDLAQAYDTLLSFGLETKDHKEVARVLALCEKNLQIDILEQVEQAEEYRGFRESDAFRSWKQNRPSLTEKSE